MNFLSNLGDQFITYYDSLIILMPKLLVGLVVLIIFLLITGTLRRKAMALAKLKTQDPLLIQFLNSGIRIANRILGILLFLYIIGLSGMAGSILGAVSISTVVLGFAFKDIGENFIAGVIMAFNRPFNHGDTVQSQSVEGSVVAMTLRHTHIKTFDGKDVYVPNAQILKNPLYNYTIDGFLRKNFTIGVEYGSDIDRVRAILLENIKTIPGVLTEDKSPRTHIGGLTSSTINVDVHYWIDTFNKAYSAFDIHTQAVASSIEKLDTAGIGMPGDIVEVKNFQSALTKTS